MKHGLVRLQSIARDAQITCVLTTSEIVNAAERARLSLGGEDLTRWFAVDDVGEGWARQWRQPDLAQDHVAYLQYTSGSTSAPQGVMVTHRNLLHHCTYITNFAGYDAQSVTLSWMPHFHDYGLVKGILHPLFAGIPTFLMPALVFLRRPIRWLEAIERHGITHSGGPNFAYAHCVRLTAPDERRALNLSSWRVASCGAEPISKDTMEQFIEAFQASGFRREAFHPAYGMAEFTLLISLKRTQDAPSFRNLDARALEQGFVREVGEGQRGVRPVVSCGHPVGETEVVIVDPETFKRCDPDEVGEIWLADQSVAKGYWNKPEATNQTFGAHLALTGEGPYLRTGDLGFVEDGELFVTGRLKDIIIIRGRNHYPQDIERTVAQSHPTLRPGSGAAFSIEKAGEERLVVVQEIERRQQATAIEEVAGAIREAVAEHHDIQVYAVAIIRAGSIPKTTSGKIQRRACKDAFLSTQLALVGMSTLGDDEPETSDHLLTRADLLALPVDQQRAAVIACLETLVGKLLSVPSDRLSTDQPLTTLGLDSLIATELAHAVEIWFGISLSLPALLDGASIGQLADQVFDQLSASPFLLQRDTRQEPSGPIEYPLSRNQSALWFLHKLSPPSTAANATLLLRILGPLDASALREALEQLAARHPALRTTYLARQGVPFQHIHPTLPMQFEETDASGWAWAELKTHAVKAGELPFDLERGPLWRAQLLKRSPTEAYLLLAAHHIAVDGWSMKILVEGLNRLYAGAPTGDTRPLLEPAAQYTDFVRWQNDLLAGTQGQRLWSYWREKLSGELPVLDLSNDRPRPPVQSDNSAWREFMLSENLTRRLKALAKAEGTTLYVTLLAALQVLLYRYTGQEDILIGSPMFGRSRGIFAETVGDFVNVAVLRDRLSGDTTFKALLSQARHTVLEAIAHQDYPFSLLVEQLQPTRDPSRAPLVQVLFVLQTFNLMTQLNERGISYENNTSGASKHLHLEPYVIPQSAGQFDLTIEISDTDGPLTGCFEYNADLFDATTIARMQEHFQVLLQGIVDQPNQLLAELPLMTPEERRQVAAWNNTRVSYTDTRCLHELFDEQVVRAPDALAVVFEDQRLSYRDLQRRANQLGHYLGKLGVGPDVLVGLCVERSLDLIVGLLGILKAGGAYLPLDPDYPTKRMASMLDDARVPILVTQQHLLPRLPDPQTRTVCLDTESSTIARESDEPPQSETTSGNLAYVIYTSGSTGKPKGVMVEHRSVVNYVEAFGTQSGPAAGDRILQLASLSFDTAVEEIFTCLLKGATLVLRTASMLDSVPRFLQKCREWHLTILDLPTAYWHELIAGLRVESLEFPPEVRAVVIGGERALRQPLLAWQRYVGSRVRLLNTYGPTEVTVAATICDLTSTDLSGGAFRGVPIGRAIQNVQVYVLDRNLRPVPIETPGELYVGGVGLARGYLNRPDLTAERFIPNPFSAEPGARLYRTGDVARWLPDGMLEYLGRVDRQVKIRGHRIELEEIESVLQTHPDIRGVAVEVREDLPGDKRLVAFIITAPGSTLSVNHLRGFLKEQLPDYMIPSTFVELDALPLTPTGKIDRTALRAPVNSRAAILHLKTEYVAPRNPTEQLLAHVWGEILDIKDVGVHDNFFELGGHSLLATQMFSRLRALFQVEPPLRAVFETPTIAGLGQWLTEQQSRGLGRLAVPITPVSREGSLPLSFAQERMWFLHQLAPESSAYNIPVSVRLIGPLNKEAFAHSLHELVRRHESLRTTFHHTESRPVQVIHPFQPPTITEVDLRTRPKERRGDEVTKLVTDEGRRSFDLTNGPLIRVMMIQVSDEEHVVVLTTHHIISDQWSYGVIGRELVQCYNAFCDGQPPQIEPPLEIQYADFACWQRDWLRGPVLDEQLSYWKAHLAGVPVLALPTDRPRQAVHSFRGTLISLDLPHSLIDGLKHLSVQDGVTLYMTFLAGFVALLHRLTGQEDIAVGTPIANRNWLAIEGLVGSFVNTLVLRTDVSGEPTFHDLLARVRDVALGAYAHQDLPFEKLVEELHPDRSHGGLPLVQVLFNFANTPFGRLDFKHLSWAPFEIDRGSSQFDLSLSIDPTVSRRVYLEFDTDLFNRASMERWLTHYRTLLEAIVEQPETAVSRLRLLPESERRQILMEWNDTRTDDPLDRCLPQLFEEQVVRTPQAIAAESQGSVLTYAELNLRANQLAHHLRSCGVGPDTVVAILMERSLDLLTCLLGIMKAGGAYLPLDTGLPSKRVSFMLENSGAALMLTHGTFAKTLPTQHVRVMNLDSERQYFTRQSRDNPSPHAGSDNLAYVIYTSGSTGKPKGVEVEHGALVNFLQSMRRRPGLTEQDVLLSVTTLSFDIAALELWLPLLVGATTIMATREEAADGTWLKDQLGATRVTVMQATPTTWRMVLEAGWPGNPRLKILCGGEALPRDLAEELLARAGSVWNMYGPTETTIWSTVHKVESGESPVSIGRPIANTQVYILDSKLEPVPVGIPGELYIGGLGLARGYRHAPDFTGARFIASPFLPSHGRMYRTGDQARWLPDGRIDCLGRIDHQVKVRGFRIELGEIESVLSEYPEVKQCVVVVRHDSPGEERVVAYVVPHEGYVLQPGHARRRLREQLPEYMVPAAVVLLSALPLTPNGKVNRLALPPPSDQASDAVTRSVTPRNRLELQLAAIWEQALGVAHIGVRDNFFDLGGHSLLALQIFGAIEQTLGKRLPLSLLLQAPTIESLAEVLSQEGCTIRWDALVAIQPSGTKPPFFLVPGVGGNVLLFARLAKQLGHEQPVYGLQARGLDGEAPPFTRVEEMAALYVQELCAVRPKGPYLIGGTCTGGVVAYEMAQQLVRRGEQVILAIMESWHPRSYQAQRNALPVFLWPTLYSFETLIRYCQELRRLPFREWPAYWRGKFVLIKNLQKREWFTSATLYAVSRYQPKPYPGRLLNVIASTRPLSPSTQDTRLAWSELALTGDQTVFMPAENSGRLFVSPHVQELAHHLVTHFNHECPDHLHASTPGTVRNGSSRIEPATP